MTKSIINISGKELYKALLPVRITDLNYGNHTGNDKVAGLIHEARVQWLQSIALSELDIGGCGIIMRELTIEFVGQSFYGDVLEVAVYAGEVSNTSFELYFLLTNKHTKSVIARCRTVMVCYDYEKKKVTAIPHNFKLKITE